MAARAGFHALTVGAALVMATGVMSDNAMAQADEAAAPGDAMEQPLPQPKPAIAERPAKSDLDQSAVPAAPLTGTPHPTRTSARAIALPKILGSYR